MAGATKEEKIDLYQMHKREYAAARKPALVEVGPARYLSISGRGAPGGSAFADATGALYGVAFTTKMMRKSSGRQDYVVSKLEALWPNLGAEESALPAKEDWAWQLLIRTPDMVTPEEVSQAIQVLRKRGKSSDVERVQLETLQEGLCVQALHVGPYQAEAATVANMRALAESKGMEFAGTHHEIYLSDPRRVEPAKVKTILRIPVRPAERRVKNGRSAVAG